MLNDLNQLIHYYNKKHLSMFNVYMVHQMGFEPTRLPTRPSSVRVCQFRPWCMHNIWCDRQELNL